ncbi:hypothetical protein WJX72_002892 [[Myrmecia] bisecta]|uniref:LysM domain-containing protein n=1 Tax=[Myrmecia] bisecta TaxID=41462 RepID=A0AAW1R5K7_9CHLO
MEVEYVVKSGDTLLKIANKYGTVPGDIRTADGGQPNAYKLYPGLKVKVPCVSKAHKVKAGETLDSIARDHRTTVSKLERNPLPNPDFILPGQDLWLP